MRKIAILLSFAFVISLWGCSPAERANAQKTKYTQLYQSSITDLQKQPGLTMHIKSHKVTTVNDVPIVEDEEQSVSYFGLTSGHPMILRHQKISMGDYALVTGETYTNGASFLSIGTSRFCQELSLQDFLDTCIPANLLDPTLYSSIRAEKVNGGTRLYFADGTRAENWIIDDISNYQASEGYVHFDQNDTLQESAYTIRYLHGPYSVLYTVTVTYEVTAKDIITPDPEQYTKIDDVKLPVLLEKASLYLLSLDNITAKNTQILESDAGAMRWELTSQVDTFGSLDNQMALVQKSIVTTDLPSGKEDRFWSKELFLDGVYSLNSQNGEHSTSTTISPSDIRNSCNTLFLQGALTTEDISSISLSEQNGVYTLFLVPTGAFGDGLCEMACSILFDTPDLLKQLATGESVNCLEAYLSIDKYTGLPVAAGYTYQVTHMVDILSYKLFCSTEQTFSVPSTTAYDQILDAAK